MAGTLWAQLPTWCSPVGPCVGLILVRADLHLGQLALLWASLHLLLVLLGAFGTLGVGAGFALGAKLCRPDAEVWCLFGDGAFGYSLIEFDTFVGHKIPVMALIGNDAGWTQISREQVPSLGSNVACSLAYTDYHKAAQGLGAQGLLLSCKSEDQVVRVRDAQQRCQESPPAVVSILVGSTDSRMAPLPCRASWVSALGSLPTPGLCLAGLEFHPCLPWA